MVFHYPGGGSSFRPIPTSHKPVSPAQPGNRIYGGAVPALINIADTPITHSQGFSTAQNIIKPVFGYLGNSFNGVIPKLPGRNYTPPKGGLRPL